MADRRINPLARGFYTVQEAARLIEGANATRIYGWIKGFPQRETGPLLNRDYAPVKGRHELSFLDLIETRFVEHFRKHHVKPRAIRKAAEKLRAELNTSHPFATGRVHLVADKADVFIRVMRETAAETGDTALRSLTTDNFVMEQIIKQQLVPGLQFDDRNGLARRWAPRHDQFPQVIVDPYVAYGQPALPSGKATAALFAAWRAEGGDYDRAAYWTGASTQDLRAAVDFEQTLSHAAEKVAA